VVHVTTRRSRILTIGAAALIVLGAAGCTTETHPDPASSIGPEPLVPPVASPAPAPSATPAPLAIPEAVDRELARAVFRAEGPDGGPASEIVILDPPVAGVEYTTEVRCTAVDATTRIAFEVATTADESEFVFGGDVLCDGEPWLMSGPLEEPVYVSFILLEDAHEAFARIVPTEDHLSAR